MPSDPGAQLGPYQIVTSLGAGGMGVVYRAIALPVERETDVGGPTFALASIYAALGDRDRPLTWLERGFRERSFLPFAFRDPVLDPIRDDPRFHALLTAAKLFP